MLTPTVARGPKDHIHIRISRSGSKVQCKGDTRCFHSMFPYYTILCGNINILYYNIPYYYIPK